MLGDEIINLIPNRLGNRCDDVREPGVGNEQGIAQGDQPGQQRVRAQSAVLGGPQRLAVLRRGDGLPSPRYGSHE